MQNSLPIIWNPFSGFKLWIFFALSLATISCQDFFISEVTNLDIPGGESRLVVYSYISPGDSLISVHVKRSSPYFNPSVSEPVEGNAEVYMAKKGEDPVRLNYSEKYKTFITGNDEFAVEPGYNYTLTVETFNGETAEAECYVPELEYEMIRIGQPVIEEDEWGGEHITFTWSFTAKQDNSENYYSSGAYVKVYRSGSPGEENDTVLFDIFDLWIDRGDNYISDNDGRTYFFKANQWIEDFPNYDDPFIEERPDDGLRFETIDSVFVYIMQTDENYYLFHESLQNYNNFGNSPFTESVLIYSNIEGGLGVFAGYNRKDFSIP